MDVFFKKVFCNQCVMHDFCFTFLILRGAVEYILSHLRLAKICTRKILVNFTFPTLMEKNRKIPFSFFEVIFFQISHGSSELHKRNFLLLKRLLMTFCIMRGIILYSTLNEILKVYYSILFYLAFLSI